MAKLYQIISGKIFNRLYEDNTFVKLTNGQEVHHNFKFKTGLNEDFIKFNPNGECLAGGIYFTDIDKMPLWVGYKADNLKYVRIVTIPDDALVYVEKHKYKANKIMLGKRVPIEELDCWDNKLFCFRAVRQNGHALQYVKNQTPTICFEAVRQNSCALQHVKDQTEEICFMAIRQNSYALQHVKDQTEEMCYEAIRQNVHALRYVKDQTEEMCIEAIKKNYNMLQFVKNQTEAVCLEAIKQNSYASRHIRNNRSAL